MDIEISGFRHFTSAKFHVGNGITLIKGDSGTGKSTVLNAIEWCLFNRPINVFNAYSGKKTVKVSITFTNNSGIKSISRSKPPCCFSIVTTNGRKIENSLADEYIETQFGNHSTWSTMCKLEQGMQNPLFYLTNITRLDVLNSIALSKNNYNPVAFHEKINEKIKNKNFAIQEFEKDIEKVNLLINEGLKKFYREFGVSFEIHSIPQPFLKEIYQEKKERIIEINEKTILLKEILQTYEKNKIIMNFLNKEIETIKVALDNIEFYEVNETIINNKNELNDRLTFLIQQEKLKEQKLQYENELRKIPHFQHCNLSLDEFHEKMKIIRRNELILEKYHITYEDIEKINEELQYLIYNKALITKALQIKKDLEKLKKEIQSLTIENIQEQIQDFQEEITLGEETINKLNNELSEYRNRIVTEEGGFINCPKCNYAFKVQESGEVFDFLKENEKNNKYINSLYKKISIIELKNENIKKQISQLNGYFILFERKKTLENSLHEFSINWELLEKYDNPEKILKELQMINTEYQSFDFTESDIVLTKKYNTLKNKIDVINFEEFNPSEISKIKKFIDEIENEEKKININKERNITQEMYKKRLSKLENERESIPHIKNPTKEIETLTLERERLSNELRQHEFFVEFKELIQQLEVMKKTYENILVDLSLLQDLKKDVLHTEHILLENTIKNIEQLSNNILSELFDDDLLITLELTKTSKTTMKTTPQVHFNIHYKGVECDFSMLSGGEAQRVSLAITIALSSLNDFHWVLMDETLNSLSTDKKVECMEVIKKYCNNCIIIEHDEVVHGFSDNIIQLCC